MPLFPVTSFLSAALAFVVQPLIAKRLLPYLGGSPAVWSTSLLFFQGALLGGYALAHLLARRRLQIQIGLQVLLLTAASLMAVRAWNGRMDAADASEAPVAWLLGVLAATVGLPFIALSVNSTLLQRWAAVAEPGRNPYVLYRWSNLGSLIGLLAFPLVLEPWLTGTQQWGLWTTGFVITLVLVGASGIRALKRASAGRIHTVADGTAGESITMARRQAWVMLAFIPSSLTLGVTTHITTDLAAVPLLWVIPLALYLLSFALTFGPQPARALRVAGWVFPTLLVAAFAAMARAAFVPAILSITIHSALLFVTGLLAHGALAADRPPTSRLTEFYLLVATGGVLGGAFNALAAPRLFAGPAEYPLVLVLAAFVLPGLLYGRGTALLDGPLGLGAGLALIFAGSIASTSTGAASSFALVVVFAVPAVLLTVMRKRWLRFGMAALAVYVATGAIFPRLESQLLAQTRTFFGVLRVTVEDEGRFHVLRHGTTMHGRQAWRDDRARRVPLSYYHPRGPVGLIVDGLRARGRPLRVGVIGLGIGTMAAFAERDDTWTFYEIDEAIVTIAKTRSWFTYLSDAPVEPEIVVGDARLSLAREAPRRFDLLVLDAFTSDAIPVHLLTLEAFELYRSHLAPGGFMAVNVTNRHLDLAPLVATIGTAISLDSRAMVVGLNREAQLLGFSSARWMVLGEPRALEAAGLRGGYWQDGRELGRARMWRDDYSNLVGLIKWRR